MSENHHVDLSMKLYKRKATGIACLGIPSKRHVGCALSTQLKKNIRKRLFISLILKEEYAKLYAICIYYLIKDRLNQIKKLIICNDEDFHCVHDYLQQLLIDEKYMPEIISITEFRNGLNRKVKSPADNYAKLYRTRALSKLKWNRGINLNVIEITFSMITEKWEELK